MYAIITAAGKNSRMIKDFENMNKTPIHKLKLKINNKEILIHTIENVLNSDVEKVTLCLGHFKHEIISLLEEYDLANEVNLSINPLVDVGLSKTIENALRNDTNKYYLFTAADQPTITTQTINNLIDTLNNSPHPKNTISVLRRRKYGKLNTAEGLGMPFCCYGKLLYDYIHGENDNLNPILRKMIDDKVDFYGVKEKNKLELLNINHYDDYLYIKNEIEKK